MIVNRLTLALARAEALLREPPFSLTLATCLPTAPVDPLVPATWPAASVPARNGLAASWVVGPEGLYLAWSAADHTGEVEWAAA